MTRIRNPHSVRIPAMAKAILPPAHIAAIAELAHNEGVTFQRTWRRIQMQGAVLIAERKALR